MNLEAVLRNAAKPVMLFGAAAYLALNLIACNGSATPIVPTITPQPSPTPAATATRPPPEETAVPTPTYQIPTPSPTPHIPPTVNPPTVTPVVPTPTQTQQAPTPTATATATATPVASFTQEKLKQKLSSLDEILRAEEPTLDSEGRDYKGYAQKVQDIFEAGYYLTTGKTPQQHNIEVKILTRVEYERFIDEKKLSPYLKGVPAFHVSFLKSGGTSSEYTHFLVIGRGGKHSQEKHLSLWSMRVVTL